MTHAENETTTHVPKVFVVYDQQDTALVWSYILRQQGVHVILEKAIEKAIEHWSAEILDLIVLDINSDHLERMKLYKKMREDSVVPLILLLPAYHEMEVLEAYAAGVDDVVIKPISPPVFMAKIMAWIRRSWTVPVGSYGLVNAGNHRLEPAHRCLIQPDGMQVRLTNLEYHLLHLLMSRPAHVFSSEEIVLSIWGRYGNGDQGMLKNVVYRLRRKASSTRRLPRGLPPAPMTTNIGNRSWTGSTITMR